jgi:hypothetical protein
MLRKIWRSKDKSSKTMEKITEQETSYPACVRVGGGVVRGASGTRATNY